MRHEAIMRTIEGPMKLVLFSKGRCKLYVTGPSAKAIIEDTKHTLGKTEFTIEILAEVEAA